MKKLKEREEVQSKEESDDKLLECIILAGLIARSSWDLDTFNVKNVIEKKVKPIVRYIKYGN